ncbi:zn 2cys6 transcription factor [Colletotrichum truncatum]|uniref:Zn 2cys6 transcription factor n=1 Tax=Colletotrichum truncatum TaxID=5467 RepID=A0ACC3Z3H8_COLTU|nr:zn 2cys6 transcription factor [Colletotrichum truncatum]KAF6795504.1 zn 2cys6 transcription factor [Colletotrichum truncatum]
MAHRNNRNNIRNHNAAFWAGQPAHNGSQQWVEGYDSYSQPVGSSDFLNTEAKRSPQSLIQEFNADLPSCPEPQGVDFDFSFDLAIGSSLFENHDLGVDVPGLASCGLARTISHASSNGIDEVESVTFSQSDELYESFGEGIFNRLNSPATTNFSEVIVSSNASLDDGPTVSRRPFLNIQTDGRDLSRNALLYASSYPSDASYIGHGLSAGDLTSRNTPTTVSKQNGSALSVELSDYTEFSPSPTAAYYDDWNTPFTDEMPEALSQSPWGNGFPPEDFILIDQDQSGPALVVHPPEASGQPNRMDDIQASTMFPVSPIHQTDDVSSYVIQGGIQSNLDSEIQIGTVSATGRLEVPFPRPSSRPRRPSDPTRPSSALNTQTRTHRVLKFNDHRSSRPTASRPIRSQSPLSLSRSDAFQRSSLGNVACSGMAAPVPIVSGSKMPETKAISPTGTSPSTRQGPARGRRSGPMNSASREQAKDTRNKKMVCIRCKHSKQACKRIDDSPDSPCSQCDKHGSSNKWPGPCVRAHFEDIILSGSCNYISQRTINHPSVDGTRRIRKELPRGFPIDSIIATLERVRYDFDLRVYYEHQPVYVLNLEKCYDYVLSLSTQVGRADDSLRSFIDKDLVRIDSKSEEWENCMDNLGLLRDNPLALFCVLSNMPSRARYSYVYKNSFSRAQEHFIDPESPDESENLALAAQLTRIINRKVEVKAFAYLQRTLHKSDNLSETELLPLLQTMGYILTMLRWKSSWWAVTLGNSLANDDEGARAQCQNRVLMLCRVLYFYYCSVRRKLAMWSTIDALRGVPSKYPDTESEVWDDFPGDETADAFEAWMSRGQELVDKAGALRVLDSMGLLA